MPQDFTELLKSLAKPTAIGAGVGAAGMGVAHMVSPEERKQRSLLKSMLLGGALGGLTGAGTSAVSQLTGVGDGTPTTTPSGFQSTKDVVAANPGIIGATAGAGTTVLAARRNAAIEKLILAKGGDDVITKLNARRNVAAGKAIGRGGLIGLGTYGLAKGVQAVGNMKETYNDYNNVNSLSQLAPAKAQ